MKKILLFLFLLTSLFADCEFKAVPQFLYAYDKNGNTYYAITSSKGYFCQNSCDTPSIYRTNSHDLHLCYNSLLYQDVGNSSTDDYNLQCLKDFGSQSTLFYNSDSDFAYQLSSTVLDFCKSANHSDSAYSHSALGWVKDDNVTCIDGYHFDSEASKCVETQFCDTLDLDSLAVQHCYNSYFVKSTSCSNLDKTYSITCFSCDEVLNILNSTCSDNNMTLNDFSCNYTTDSDTNTDTLSLSFSDLNLTTICKYSDNNDTDLDSNTTDDNNTLDINESDTSDLDKYVSDLNDNFSTLNNLTNNIANDTRNISNSTDKIANNSDKLVDNTDKLVENSDKLLDKTDKLISEQNITNNLLSSVYSEQNRTNSILDDIKSYFSKLDDLKNSDLSEVKQYINISDSDSFVSDSSSATCPNIFVDLFGKHLVFFDQNDCDLIPFDIMSKVLIFIFAFAGVMFCLRN